ncbi:MAG: ABC transporter permease [Erysipelotrichaceae bacterium]|jgi:ABC-2 type transport system permease protein|nr:ABC transporter permease [Erysipelotrichaceae bacterium]
MMSDEIFTKQKSVLKKDRTRMNTTLFLTEFKLYLRSFYGPFFALVFPLLMLVLFGSIYGNEPTPFYGGRGSMDVMMPGNIALILCVSAFMGLPLTLGENKDNRVYKRFDATPAGKERVILIQILVQVAVTVIGVFLQLGVGWMLYRVQISHLWLLFIGVCAAMYSLFSMGYLIAAASPNLKITNAICYTLYFGMMFISGCSLPREILPDSINRIAKLFPLTHTVDLLNGITQNQSLSQYWLSWAVLLGGGTICFLISLYLSKKNAW